jgi:hypothetical protein
MSVKRVDNTAQVKNTIHQQMSLMLRLMLDDIYRMAQPITPKRRGPLSQQVTRTVLGLVGSIEWNKSYAAAQEAGFTRGYPIKKYTTPGTGKGFAVKSVSAVIAKTSEYVVKATRV